MEEDPQELQEEALASVEVALEEDPHVLEEEGLQEAYLADVEVVLLLQKVVDHTLEMEVVLA